MEANYASALRASEQVAWRLNDVLAPDAQLDFQKDFLPESLVGATALDFLHAGERRTLNQIRAHGYLSIFGLVEEFILPFVLDRLQRRAGVDADLSEVRALLAFAGEEAKHIALFRRFRDVFRSGFGHPCEVIGPPAAVSEHVLGHSELGVGLLILHIEWMTQKHYVEAVREDVSLEPSFRRLLHQHWVEESQHARIDAWIVESVAAVSSYEYRVLAFEDYVKLLRFLEQGLSQQVTLDLAAFERATGRVLGASERARFIEAQQRAQHRTYLGSGVEHPRVQATVGQVHPDGLTTLRALARRYA